MRLETVNSNAIHAIGYDDDTRTMEIIFTGGGIYQFQNVPPNVFYRFRASVSKGSYFQNNIRGRFPHQRLGKFRPRRRMVRRFNPNPTRPSGDLPLS